LLFREEKKIDVSPVATKSCGLGPADSHGSAIHDPMRLILA